MDFTKLHNEIKTSSNSAKIIGVLKKQKLETVKQAVDAGLKDLGVNYVQEGEIFKSALSNSDITWHFIGHIQSRKVKDLINYDWIHSLDRLEIAEALNLLLEKANRTVQALIQVNIGGEATKSGIAENDLESFIERVSNLKNIKLRGLMAMVPALNPVEQRRSYFKKMKSLLKQHQSIPSFDSLSMGTSEDYKIAIEEGATYIRLGTVLFGNRI